MTIEDFIKAHINKINEKISDFKGTEYTDIDIKNFLQNKFKDDIKDPNTAELLLEELSSINFIKAKIVDIANKYGYYKPHLEKFYQIKIFSKIFYNFDKANITNLIIDTLNKDDRLKELEIKFIEKDLRILINKSLFVATQGGFSSDLQGSELGLGIANEGDSAQFLFIARAILAGFNCSNVDVRSSRYDAIIDYNNILLRVQIKGISTSNTISFFDRDRGGQGIDHKHERNKGKRITSKDCDIYVAVDKQVGICYIIPMSFSDNLTEEVAKNIKLDALDKYLENWQVIKDVVKEKTKFK